jgi:hypothetical protein
VNNFTFFHFFLSYKLASRVSIDTFMNDSSKKEVLIPQQWRQRVASILRKNDKDTIISRQQADRDWQSAFPASWDFERFEAMASALDSECITGRHIINMEPPCDTYEFWFNFDGRKVLGKIGLLGENRIIIIFSSHIPRKGDTL